ncbi:MAG: HNH endonuclease [Myxococcota bacterium]
MQFDSSLSNAELLARMPVLASCDRGATADVIEHLMEIDRRKLYLGQACSSLSAYCRERLDYSEDEAGKRVRLARLARDVPQVLHELRGGRVHLTGLFLLAPHITRENANELLSEARGKSRREIERLIAVYFPRPDVEESITPTMMRSTATTPSIAKGADRLKPLSASTVLLQFTASSEFYAKIERARELLSHSIPGGELAAVLERAVEELIQREEKRRLGAGVPRKRRPLKEGSRHVPVEVARAVWQRDGGQCSFIDSEGRRCSERRFITIEHRVPFARGGAPTLENLCLLCSPHNSYSAELAFGAEHIQRKQQESRRKQVRRSEPTARAWVRPAAKPTSIAKPTACAEVLIVGAEAMADAKPLADAKSMSEQIQVGAQGMHRTRVLLSGPEQVEVGAQGMHRTRVPLSGPEQVEVGAQGMHRTRVLLSARSRLRLAHKARIVRGCSQRCAAWALVGVRRRER